MAKNYVRDTSGLKRYQQARRDAKRIGGAYEQYVNQYYKVSKSLRKRGVKLAQTGSRVLTPQQFAIDIATERIGPHALVAEQFGLLSGNQARVLQGTLKAAGFDISLQRAMTRQLNTKEWQLIDQKYIELKAAGLSSEAAKLEISNYFFGS